MGLGTMIRSLVTIVLLLFSTTSGRQSNWDSHSAYILPPKSWSVGIFQPLRYGLQEGLELSSHPGWFFVIPNASFKIPFLDFKSFNTAAKVSFTYPTPLLNIKYFVELDKYDSMDRATMERNGLWSEFQMSKAKVIQYVLKDYKDTLKKVFKDMVIDVREKIMSNNLLDTLENLNIEEIENKVKDKLKNKLKSLIN